MSTNKFALKIQTSSIVPSIIDAHQEQYQNEERECDICKKKFLGKTFFRHLKDHKLKKNKKKVMLSDK